MYSIPFNAVNNYDFLLIMTKHLSGSDSLNLPLVQGCLFLLEG